MAVVLLGPALSAPVGAEPLTLTEPARVTALAVSVNETGELVGANASIEVRVADEGSGHVFMDTRPLSGTDLQGSARIAARVAAGLTDRGLQGHDFFYTVRSDSPVISGPSAGAIMTLAALVALENAHVGPDEEPWEIREDVMATGTINPDGSVGPVGGILEKARAAEDAGADTFLFPAGETNYTPRLPPEQAEHGEAPVNVPDFCERHLNVTCRPVAAVERLVEIATGRQLPGPELGEPPTTAQYEDVLGPRTRDIVERSQRVFETWDRVNETTMPPAAEERARASIEQAVRAHHEADRLWDDDRFYSAASQAFQSVIRERHARLLVEFHERGASPEFLRATVEHAADEVRDARSAAREAEATGLQSLYTVGAGQERVSDAERRLDAARSGLSSGGDSSPVLLQSAWALERANTVHWWLNLTGSFGEGPELPEEPAQLADEFTNLARELIAYSSSVTGGQSPEQARQVLKQANRDQERGFHAAAIVEAAEAQVLASLALEQRGGEPTPSKVNASRQQSALSIQKARGLGVEPILPVAMFEFAATTEDPSTSIRFYRTANVLAGLSSVLSGDLDPNPSRFVDPSSDEEEPPRARGPIEGWQPGVASWALVGVFAALATITLGVAIARGDGDER